MARGDALKGKWRGNWQTGWVTSTLHTVSEHGVPSITTADAHTSAASSRLNWRPTGRFKRTRPFCRKTKSGFCACAITFQLASTMWHVSNKYDACSFSGDILVTFHHCLQIVRLAFSVFRFQFQNCPSSRNGIGLLGQGIINHRKVSAYKVYRGQHINGHLFLERIMWHSLV